jgi:hypothetical protein
MAVWDPKKNKWVNSPVNESLPLQSGPSATYNATTNTWVKPKPVDYSKIKKDPLVVWRPSAKRYEYTNSFKEPKYSFEEAMKLSEYGYTGVFGRSADKQTLGLLGQNWQQVYALERLRSNQRIPQLNILTNYDPGTLKSLMAATPLVPGKTKYNALLGLYTAFGDKYGAGGEKYTDRYGALPKVGSKYGILFNTNNQKIRSDDVNVTYQNDLVKTALSVSKDLAKIGEEVNSPVLSAKALEYAGYNEYKIKSTRAKYNPDKVKELEASLNEVPRIIDAVAKSLGGEEQSQYSSVATGIIAGLGATTVMGPTAGVFGNALGSSEAGAKKTAQALDYMNGLAESDILRGRKTYWSDKASHPWSQYGLIGLTGNTLRGVARMGLGLPAGITLLSDEAYLAGKETAKWAVKDDYGWGEDIDFKMGDAIWADYAQRYYDPFAKDAEGKDRSWLDGLSDPTSYDRFGEKINNDPSALVLDILDIAPVVGWGAKAGAVASVAARTGRLTGKVGLKAADEAALQEAKIRARGGVYSEYKAPNRVAAAQDLMDSLERNPDLMDVVDEGAIREAAQIVLERQRVREAENVASAVRQGADVDDVTIQEADTVLKAARKAQSEADKAKALDKKLREEALARAEQDVLDLQAKIDQAPSARTFRRTVRNAINGDALSQAELGRWRAMGYEFNGADKSFSIRTSALFEPRTKVLAKPESVLAANDNAIIRLPASPIMRGMKEAFFWVGRGVDKAALAASSKEGYTGRIGTKFIDMPLLSYRYNYTKAIKTEAIYEYGDVATELQRATRLKQIDDEADLRPSMRRAMVASLMGGEGKNPLQSPAIQRQQIQDKINKLPRDKVTGEIVRGAQVDLQNLQKALNDLLDNEIDDVQKAAESFDEMFDQDLTDLQQRLADPTHKDDSKELDIAVDLWRRLDKQDQAVRSRIVHDDTTPQSIEHLKLLYSEAMDGLRLSATKLFGKEGNKGRIGKYTTKVLRVNTNLLLTGLAKRGDREALIDLAQNAEETGTVFDSIANVNLRKQRKDEMVQAVEALNRIGMFVDGMGSHGTIGRPVLVQAAVDVGNDFVAFHIPTLRHEIDKGRVYNGRIIDPNEVYVLPKVFFSAKKKGKGAVVLESPDVGKELLYTGALNAMSSVYPKARFYSEKINDTGLRGVRQNEQMIGNEHRVAESGMRQHALSRVLQSQVHYMKNRVERDLRSLAESQAVLVPASQVVGKSAKESGYHVLHNVRPFDNAADALDFARLRGVSKEAEQALMAYSDGTISPIETTLDVNNGLGVRIGPNGEPEFLVRGGMHDWVNEAIQEDLGKHSTVASWINREFSRPEDIPRDGMVLAIPNRAYKDLAQMTLEADNLSARILNATAIKGWGNLMKWFVLNANPGFIANNVIGGTAMMLMYNPSVAPRILASVVQKMARESIVKRFNNDAFTLQLTHFKNESEAVARSVAYENEHNVYRQEAGIAGAAKQPNWFKKNVWHGGYTVVGAWEEMMRRNVAMQFLRNDDGFQSFMRGPEVKAYINSGVDWHGNIREGDDAITPFEAATDLLLDRGSPFFNANLKHRMRYMTNTVSGNYHYFNPTEQLMRNVVMPFYAWQRHSATFSYRMLVDKPITTNVLYNIGQQGYQQNLEQGVPEWMMGTIPVPRVIKDMFDITDDDFRIDGNALSPFGTAGEMGMAAFGHLTGAESNNNIFDFTNPYLNQMIKDTLHVDPRTGNIDWEALREENTDTTGILGTGQNIIGNFYKATYPSKLMELAKYKEYEEDALSNKYAAVENAPDILKNYDPNDPEATWKLKIPKMRSTNAANPTQRVLSAMGVKSYYMNPTTLPMGTRKDAVGAMVLQVINNDGKKSRAEQAANAASEWKRRYDYVMEVWLPAAEAQGFDPLQIELVLSKIMDERPKTGLAKQLSLMGG